MLSTSAYSFAQDDKENSDNTSLNNMILVPSGSTIIGSKHGKRNEQPTFKAWVKQFYLDQSPVSVVQFRSFISESNYQTLAEKQGNANVFNFNKKQWLLTKGANWKSPMGEDNEIAKDNHPVTQISWEDALHYCQHLGKRLPTEIEWEYAANNAQDPDSLYAFGKRLITGNQYKANVWQGTFPQINSKKDGFLTTSPIGYYGKTKLGFNDMAGNVWEWTQDDYKLYEEEQTAFDSSQKVLKGGSFMCDPEYCHGFRVSAREPLTKNSPSFHVGFRCAADKV